MATFLSGFDLLTGSAPNFGRHSIQIQPVGERLSDHEPGEIGLLS
jgi:hypothetical protein